jgi:hypothetical protein
MTMNSKRRMLGMSIGQGIRAGCEWKKGMKEAPIC